MKFSYNLTSKERYGSPDTDGSKRCKLSHCHFDEEQRQASQDQHDGVGDEEGSTAIRVGSG